MKYALRQATAGDYDFLYRLKATTLKPYVAATWGWDEADQQARFAAQFRPETSCIVVVDGRDVGELKVERRKDEFHIAGIYILPAWQGRGLGSQIILDVIDRATGEGQPVSLQVLKVNPARRLYERLGFEVVEVTETHFLMRLSIPAGQ